MAFSSILDQINICFIQCEQEEVWIQPSGKIREGGYQGWAGYFFCRIPDIRYPDSFNIRNPAGYHAPDYRITGYPALKISWISNIRIVSISVNRSDIENGRISGPTLDTFPLGLSLSTQYTSDNFKLSLYGFTHPCQMVTNLLIDMIC